MIDQRDNDNIWFQGYMFWPLFYSIMCDEEICHHMVGLVTSIYFIDDRVIRPEGVGYVNRTEPSRQSEEGAHEVISN